MIMTLCVNRLMDNMQNASIQLMEKTGSSVPVLIIVSDSSINFNYLYPLYENIIDIYYSEWLTGLKISVFSLSLKDKHDTKLLNSLSEYIATNHSPLAIGYIGMAYYKVVDKAGLYNVEGRTLNLDPESVRVLLTRFYLKDNKNIFVQTNPFFIEKYSPEEDLHNSKFDFGLNEDINKKKYTVNLLPTPWSIIESNNFDDDNKNPYFAQKSF
jgi:hypothetical protein